MEAKDLIIGNFVEYNGMYLPVSSIKSPKPLKDERFANKWLIELFDGASWIDCTIDDLKPIRLTEEWLLKFGFDKRDDQKYYHVEFNRTWVSLDSILVKWYGNALGGIMMLDYVHQLQNIFSAINSVELNLTKIPCEEK